MCRYAMAPYKTHFVCLPCRKVWKGGGSVTGERIPPSKHCPHCGAEGIDMGMDFHTPRRGDDRQWRKVELMVERGVRFQGCGCRGPGGQPDTLSDAKSKYGLRRKRLKV